MEKKARSELDQAQFKLELELSFTLFKICCIKLINKLLATWTTNNNYPPLSIGSQNLVTCMPTYYLLASLLA